MSPHAEHPKIKERRSDVGKDKSRRRAQAIFALSFVSMIGVIVLAVVASPAFNVDEVKAAGYIHTDPEALIAAADIALGTQLTDIDTEQASQRVLDSSAWISSARVERSWKGSVTVYVTERTPAIAMGVSGTPEPQDGGTFMLIDENGKQLEEVTSLPSGILAVSGLRASGRPGQPGPVEALAAAAVAKALSPELMNRVSNLVIEAGQVRLKLHDNAVITFGDANSLAAKVIAVETLFAKVDMRCLHEIDVRVPDSPTITRRSRDGQERAIVVDLTQCL
jgi:cell division septal protein FtsQ